MFTFFMYPLLGLYVGHTNKFEFQKIGSRINLMGLARPASVHSYV